MLKRDLHTPNPQKKPLSPVALYYFILTSPPHDAIVRQRGEHIAQETLEDNDLLALFNKAQKLSQKQKETVKDFLSAFVLKADLTQKLTQ